jgi:hypothetical protein
MGDGAVSYAESLGTDIKGGITAPTFKRSEEGHCCFLDKIFKKNVEKQPNAVFHKQESRHVVYGYKGSGGRSSLTTHGPIATLRENLIKVSDCSNRAWAGVSHAKIITGMIRTKFSLRVKCMELLVG